jgi:hypothetical protein
MAGPIRKPRVNKAKASLAALKPFESWKLWGIGSSVNKRTTKRTAAASNSRPTTKKTGQGTKKTLVSSPAARKTASDKKEAKK